MKGDDGVIKFLDRAIHSELQAIDQYRLHAAMFDNWGIMDLAKHELSVMDEEREHLAHYLDRILFLQGSTTMVPDPLRIGADVGSIFTANLAGEMDAIKLYTEAAAYCQEVGDYVSRDIFELTLADEQEHANYLETQQSLIARLGVELYTEARIGGLS